MITYPQIAARLFNRPLLMPQHRLEPLLSVLGPRLNFSGYIADGEYRALSAPGGVVPNGRQSAGMFDEPEDVSTERYRPYPVRNGIAVIEIIGTLVNRGKWIGDYCGQTSYEGLAQQIGTAAVDPAVRGILLDIACGGGEAAGCQSMANLIAEVAAEKPVWAAVSDEALSAAYWLASAAGVICLPELGEVGSIGVWCLHVDQSKHLEKEGITPTLIFAGQHKVDGHPFAALPDSVRDAWQANVDHTRRVFTEGVARYRGLDVDSVLKTEAKCLTGAAAIQAGLADEIMDRYQAEAALASFLSAP